MLSSFKLGILTLINNALNGTNNPLPEDFNYSKLYNFAVGHQIMSLLYYGGAHNPEFISNDIDGNLRYSTLYTIVAGEKQFYEAEKVFAAFEENGIDYMKLKGVKLRDLYPRSEMRVMGDADILIREEQMDKIENIMQSLGYTHIITSDHEWIWGKGEHQIELHKKLIPSYVKSFYTYFGSGWDFAKKVNPEGFEHEMSPEDEFIYLFAHFAKHYGCSGIGIKHTVDLYLFLQKHASLDFGYINAQFEKLDILKFFENVKVMLDVWFKNAPCDEISEFLTNKIFANGAYGNQKASLVSQAAMLAKGKNAKVAKFKKLAKIVFPKYEHMCKSYTWINGKPLLLPVAWVYRIVKVLLFKRDNITKHKSDMKIINKNNIDSYRAELDMVGLNFDFEV